MTNTNQSPAGDVEAREAADDALLAYLRRHGLDNLGNPNERKRVIDCVIGAYLAKLTSIKPEPSRIAEIQASLASVGDVHWRSMRDGNQYFDEGKTLVGASRVDGLRRAWNPYSGLAPVLEEVSRFSDVVADFIANAPKAITDLLSHITAIEAEKAALSQKVRELTTLLDAQLGTPCEQIRHQQEVEELKADRDRMREALENILRCDDEAREAAGIEGATLNGYGLVDLFDVLDHPFGSGAHKQSAYRSNDLNNALSNARAALTPQTEEVWRCPNTNRGLHHCGASAHPKHGGGHFYSCTLIDCPLMARATTQTEEGKK